LSGKIFDKKAASLVYRLAALSFHKFWLSRIYRENPYTEHTELTETHGKGFLNNDFSVFLCVFRVFRVQKNTHPGDSQRP
jgi:hypothetical protein